jgi:hypothetical protein
MIKEKNQKVVSYIFVIINGLFATIMSISYIGELLIDNQEIHYGPAFGCWYYNSRIIYYTYFGLWTLLLLVFFSLQIRCMVKHNFKKANYSGLIFIILILAHFANIILTCDSNI